MHKYRYFRPYRRRYFTATGILMTLLVWSVLLAVDILKFAFKCTIKLIKWIRNTYHFRNINYSYEEIVRLIRNMSPREFEIFCAELFKYHGYDVELTEATCDGGKDIILWDNKGKKIYVEIKHFSENVFVGRPIVQKLIGAMVLDKADECIIVTTGQYHNNAIECALKYDNLTLLGFKDIMGMIRCLDAHILPRIFVKTFNSESKCNTLIPEY